MKFTVRGNHGECGHEHGSISDCVDCYQCVLLSVFHERGEVDATIQIRRTDGVRLSAEQWIEIDDALRDAKLVRRIGRPLSPLTLKQLDTLKETVATRMHQRQLLRHR